MAAEMPRPRWSYRGYVVDDENNLRATIPGVRLAGLGNRDNCFPSGFGMPVLAGGLMRVSQSRRAAVHRQRNATGAFPQVASVQKHSPESLASHLILNY